MLPAAAQTRSLPALWSLPQKNVLSGGRQLSAQSSKPFLTALRFSGGHGCASLMALRKMETLLIYPAEERAFEARLREDPAQAGRQKSFAVASLLLLCLEHEGFVFF